MNKPTAVAYLRRSHVDPDRPGVVAHEQQLAAVRKLAAEHGDDPEQLIVLEDWGRSGRGSKTHLRVGFARLEAMIDAGQVTAIYSYSMTRLARSLEHLTRLAKRCKAAGIPIRLADGQSPDVSTASGMLVMNIVGAVAEWQADWTAERAVEGTAVRRRRGDHIGPAPYGSRVVGGQLVARSGEDPEVILDAYARAGTVQGASRLLNAEKVPTRTGKPWVPSTLGDMLRRLGAIDRPAPRGRPTTRAYTFAKLLRCPHCGRTLTPDRWRSRVIYECREIRHDAAHPRPSRVSETDVMAWARDEASRLRPPEGQVAVGEPGEREALEARRKRVIDNYEDGLFGDGPSAKAERDMKLTAVGDDLARLAALAGLETIPDGVDWSWQPGTVNGVLRALWDRVELDGQMRPKRAAWTVPEWRGELSG